MTNKLINEKQMTRKTPKNCREKQKGNEELENYS